MQLFTGSVVFAADPEPKDWGNGPRYSIKVLLDQAAPAGAKTDDRGRVAVYVNPTDAETPYLRSLKRDDRVQLSWDEGNSKKKSLDLIIPTGFAGAAPASPPAISQYAAPPPATSHQPVPYTTAPASPPVWYPLSDEESEAFLAIAGHSMDLAIILMSEAQVKLANAGFVTDDLRVIQALAAGGNIQAQKDYRRGMTVYKPAELDEVERAFLAGLDTSTPDALLASVLDGIGTAIKESRNDVAALLKSFGLSRDAITGSQDSQLFLLNVARTYADTRLADGEAAARRKVEAKFGLKDASVF